MGHGVVAFRKMFTREEFEAMPDDWRVLVAPVNVNVDAYNVYQPDLIVLPPGGEKPSLDWEIPTPIWVVEILSPSTARYDRDVKLPRLASKGVREAWLIDPRATEIAVYGLRGGAMQRFGPGDVAESRTVPGFRLALSDFF